MKVNLMLKFYLFGSHRCLMIDEPNPYIYPRMTDEI